MNGATPAQAAAHAFVTGCVERGITASQAAVPPEGQLATVRGLWADVAQAVIDASVSGLLDAVGVSMDEVVAAVTASLEGVPSAPGAAAAREPRYVIFRKTAPGAYPTAHGPYSETEAARLSDLRGDNESRLKLMLNRDLEDR